MDAVVLIARILFAALFLMAAVGHLSQTETRAAYAEAKGLPMARLAVLTSGVVWLVGGLMVLIGVWADLGALLLFVALVPTAVLMHGPWTVSHSEEREAEHLQFLKDLALAGAALMLFAFFAALPDLGLMLTDPLFDRLWGLTNGYWRRRA